MRARRRASPDAAGRRRDVLSPCGRGGAFGYNADRKMSAFRIGNVRVMAKQREMYERRMRTITARANGMTFAEIARREGVQERTIYRDMATARDTAIDNPDTMLYLRVRAARIMGDAEETGDALLELKAMARLESAVSTTVKVVDQRDLEERVEEVGARRMSNLKAKVTGLEHRRRRAPTRILTPTPVQREFIDLPYENALISGARGTGKSFAIAFLIDEVYAQDPTAQILLVGQTESSLKQGGGVLSAIRDLRGGDLRENKSDRTLIYPSGATVHYRGLADSESHLRSQGASYHAVICDEAGQLYPAALRWLPTLLRQGRGDSLPLRYRLTANPGGRGHNFLYKEFVVSPNDGDNPNYHLHTLAGDNPELGEGYYERAFRFLDGIELAHAQGDWHIRPDGMMPIEMLANFTGSVDSHIERSDDDGFALRSWDLAATQDGGDWTAGTRITQLGARLSHR